MVVEDHITFLDKVIKPLGYFQYLPENYNDLFDKLYENKTTKITYEYLDTKMVEDLSIKINSVEDAVTKFHAFWCIRLVDELIKCCFPITTEAYLLYYPTQDNQKPLDNVVSPSIMIRIQIHAKPAKHAQIEDKIRSTMLLGIYQDENKSVGIYAQVVQIVNRGDVKSIFIDARMEEKFISEFEKLKKNKVSIHPLPNINTALKVKTAITNMPNTPEIAKKIFPKLTDIKSSLVDFFTTTNFDSCLKRSIESNYLDNKQHEAVEAINCSVTSTFILIGPPGTGKTLTLVAAIQQLLLNNDNRRILVCAPTNKAADTIAEEIINKKFLPLTKIFRLNSASRDVSEGNQNLNLITRISSIKNDDFEIEKLIYSWPELKEFLSFKIIISTLGIIPTFSEFYKPLLNYEESQFSHIIIDEAGQSPEIDCWVPLQLLGSPKTRLILAGDPKQLGPVTTVRCLESQTFGYKTSLMSRLYENSFFDRSNNKIQLITNYRSHPAIVRISSNLFYNGEIKPKCPAGCDSLCKFIKNNKNHPVIFNDIRGEEKCSDNGSYCNLIEVEAVINYIKKMKKEGKIDDNDIGIISPCKYQANCIQEKLGKDSKILIATVEKFQGMEKRVIIITTVRSGYALGFMADNLRFNTAISRAKHLLVVVGNSMILQQQPSWKK